MVAKPFNLTKFGKTLSKTLKVETGFHDPQTWVDTGCYALNYRISGSFFKGVPLDGKVTVFAGESGSGKSYIVSGNMIRWAIENDVMVILFDSENALDRSWMQALRVAIDDEKVLRVPVGSPDDVALALSQFIAEYRELYENVPYEERQKMLFVIDSIGMLSTTSEQEQFQRGEMKGDKGIKAKSLKALVTQALRIFSGHPVGMVATAHSYKSQDMYNPDDVIGGGVGFIYASSIVVGMNKLKLKEDDEGNKISEVRGIRAKVKVVKSRYSKPFEEVEVRIPYDTGMNPYSGLFEMFEKMGLLVKSGTRYEWVDENGEIHKYYRREWMQNTDLLTRMMKSVEARDAGKEVEGFDDTHKTDFL